MKLAVNFSPQAAALTASGAIDVDLFKLLEWPEFVDQAQAIRPTYIHFGIRAEPGGLERVDWALVEDLLARTPTRHVNLHLLPEAGSIQGVTMDATDRPSMKKVFEVLLKNVLTVTERFGPDRVIVENAPYWGRFDDDVLRPVVEPETINRIVDASGCGFLLDLSHARIAARGLGLGEREYISAFPMHKLCELHVTGLGMLGDRLRDHLALKEEDWSTFAWAIGEIRAGRWAHPWVVTFEYGGVRMPPPWPCEEKDLAEQVPRLYEMVHSV